MIQDPVSRVERNWIYRWIERPFLFAIGALWAAWYVSALLDGTPSIWRALLGGFFWLLQGVLILIMVRYIGRRADRRALGTSHNLTDPESPDRAPSTEETSSEKT